MARLRPELVEAGKFCIPCEMVVDRNLSAGALKLFGCLQIAAPGEAECRATNAELAAMARVTTREIGNRLRELEAGGYIASVYRDASRRHRVKIILTALV